MMDRQIREFSDMINYTMMAYNRYRSIGDLNTIIRQYQTITLTRTVGGPAYEATYSTRARNKVIFLFFLKTKIFPVGFEFIRSFNWFPI